MPRNDAFNLEWLVHSRVQVPDLIPNSLPYTLLSEVTVSKLEGCAALPRFLDVEQGIARQKLTANNQLLWPIAGIKKYIIPDSL